MGVDSYHRIIDAVNPCVHLACLVTCSHTQCITGFCAEFKVLVVFILKLSDQELRDQAVLKFYLTVKTKN